MTRVPCGCCKGAGTVPLSGQYALTLAVLRKQREPVSGADMGRTLDISNEAACNRLKKLEKYGLAECEPYGRELLWRATK